MVQCRPPGPQRHHADLGLRSTGKSGAVRHEGAYHHERHRVVREDDLSPQTLAKYSALLLPNVALLSDAQCDSLRAYVNAGGSLLATFETSRYDQSGKPRDGLGIGDLFGVTRAGDIAGPNGNSYYARIESPHEILEGFADTKVLPGAEYRVPVKSSGAAVLTVI